MALSKSRRIVIMLAINATFLLLELSVGVAVGSLALLADAFHMLNDIISLGAGLWAVLVTQKSSTDKFSFGYFRAEILGAFFNAVFLIALCLSIVLEAFQRLLDPPEIKSPELILIVGCLGLTSNIVGYFVLGGHGHAHSHGHSHETDATHHSDVFEAGTVIEEGHNHDHASHQHKHNLHEAARRLESQGGRKLNLSKLQDVSIGPSSIASKHPHNPTSSIISTRFSQDDFGLHPESFRQNIIAASKSKLDGIYNEESNVADEETIEDPIGNSGIEPTENTPLVKKAKSGNKSIHNSNKERQATRNAANDHPKHRGSHDHGDMGMNAMILHVIGDALGNVGVILSALVIWLTNWSGRFYADPAVSMFITLIILRSTIPLTIATAKILLQATPDHIEVRHIRNDVQAIPGVVSCHHVHIWQLSDTQIVASMHLQLEFSVTEATGEKYMNIAKAVRKCLHAYGIHSATIQPEFCLERDHDHSSQVQNSFELDEAGNPNCGIDDECLIECVDGCHGKTCCSPKSAASLKDQPFNHT